MNGTDGTSEEEVKFRQQAEKERGPINRATECADTEECPGTGTSPFKVSIKFIKRCIRRG